MQQKLKELNWADFEGLKESVEDLACSVWLTATGTVGDRALLWM
jgi:hypothetical protein